MNDDAQQLLTGNKPIPALTPAQRRDLRAAAHHLNAVVSISQKGLTPTVLQEIDRCLNAHELIKVRLYGIERADRSALELEICQALGCAPVQHIGNLLVLWREIPESGELKSALAGRRSAGGPRLTKKQAAASLDGAAKRRRPKTTRKTI